MFKSALRAALDLAVVAFALTASVAGVVICIEGGLWMEALLLGACLVALVTFAAARFWPQLRWEGAVSLLMVGGLTAFLSILMPLGQALAIAALAALVGLFATEIAKHIRIG